MTERPLATHMCNSTTNITLRKASSPAWAAVRPSTKPRPSSIRAAGGLRFTKAFPEQSWSSQMRMGAEWKSCAPTAEGTSGTSSGEKDSIRPQMHATVSTQCPLPTKRSRGQARSTSSKMYSPMWDSGKPFISLLFASPPLGSPREREKKIIKAKRSGRIQSRSALLLLLLQGHFE